MTKKVMDFDANLDSQIFELKASPKLIQFYCLPSTNFKN